jgi:hypothetical protein
MIEPGKLWTGPLNGRFRAGGSTAGALAELGLRPSGVESRSERA